MAVLHQKRATVEGLTDGLAAQVKRQREAQGLPSTVQEPNALRRIAALTKTHQVEGRATNGKL